MKMALLCDSCEVKLCCFNKTQSLILTSQTSSSKICLIEIDQKEELETKKLPSIIFCSGFMILKDSKPDGKNMLPLTKGRLKELLSTSLSQKYRFGRSSLV